MLAMLMCVMPMVVPHSMSVGRLPGVRTPRKCALGLLRPWSSRIFRTCLPSVSALNSPLGEIDLDDLDADRLQVLQDRREAVVAIGPMRARCGHIWLPIGRPSGLALSLIPLAAMNASAADAPPACSETLVLKLRS